VFYEGDAPTVDFIELSSGSNLRVLLFGLAVFTTPVPALISEMERHAELDRSDPELGYSYIFPNLELAFWRPDNDDDETPYFATVGVGRVGYYTA